MPEKRDYKKEYQEYHSKPEQIKNRALRNKARKELGLKKGDPREADHIKPLSKGGDNSKENIRAVSRKTNRKKSSKVSDSTSAINWNVEQGMPMGLGAGLPMPGVGANFTMDGFSNTLARMGTGTQSLLEATQYTMSKMTRNYQLLNTLYRENWVIKRIIDTIPEDMTKNWYKIETQLPPDDIQRFAKLERTTNVRAKVLEGLKWGRLYGGAAAVIIIDGQEGLLDSPMELDSIMPGSFKGLIILDRWSGISPSLSLVMDINDPDFGLPEYYTISADTLGSGIRVHHSRILRFIGRDLPYIEKIGEQYWGASELEHVYEELKKRDNTSWNIATLIFSANLKVYKMDGMDQLALMPEKVQKDLYTTMMYLSVMMNSNGMQIIGKDDTFETHQYSFAGLSDIYELFMLDVSGAAETPVTKLFGRSPAGMNATGESDMQNYYDTIEEKQESYLRPIISKLLPVMCMSEFGAVPDDLDFSFANCRRPTEQEKKNLAKQISEAIIEAFNAGLISHRTALKELKSSSELTGMWSNITDTDIEKADDDFGIGGESEIPSDGLFDTYNNFEKEMLDGGPGSGRKPEGKSTEKPLKLKRKSGKIHITGNITVDRDEDIKLVAGSDISGIVTFAGKGAKKGINDVMRLCNCYGGNGGDWMKVRGTGMVDIDGMSKKAELHWYESEEIGVVEIKIKRWLK